MIVAYIDTYRDRFGVEPICTVLTRHGMKIAPSTYYAHKGLFADEGVGGVSASLVG